MKKQQQKITIPTTDDDDTLLSAVGDELAMEILIRLPVKSLFRSKCVSSRWLRLISNPLFVRSYTTNSSSLPPIVAFFQQFRYSDFADDQILYDQIRYYPFVNSQLGLGLGLEEEVLINYDNNFSFEFLGLKLTILLSSSMGLLLCSDSRYSPTLYIVCNPITKHWVSLPVPPRDHNFISSHLHCYNDDDGHSKKDIDNMPNKFSVFLFVGELEDFGSTALKVETFSSETGEWTLSTVAHRRSQFHSLHPCCGIFNSTACFIDLYERTIVAYDLQKGTLRFTPCPPGSHNPFFGCLSFSNHGGGEIMHYAEMHQTSLCVWDFFGGEWSLKHTISLQDLIDDGDFDNLGVATSLQNLFCSAHNYLFKPLDFHPFDPDIVLLHPTGAVVSCHIVKRKLELVFNYKGHENAHMLRCSELIPYTPMLWPAPVPPITNRTMASPCLL